MNNKFSLDDLLLFMEVVKNNGFLKTANVFNVSQSTISRRMIKLENDIGYKLFIQDGRKFKLSYAGKMIHDVMKIHSSSFSSIEQVIENIQEIKNKSTGSLRIVAPIFISEIFITPYLVEFIQKYPGIKLEIDYRSSEINMDEDNIDVVLAHYLPKNNSQKFVKLFSYNLKLFCSQHYKAKYGLPKTIDELVNHKYINAFHEDGRVFKTIEFVNKLTNQVETFNINSQLTINNLAHAEALLHSNELIVPLVTQCIRSNIHDIIPVLPEYEFNNISQEIYLQIHPYKDTFIARLFIDFIKNKFLSCQ